MSHLLLELRGCGVPLISGRWDGDTHGRMALVEILGRGTPPTVLFSTSLRGKEGGARLFTGSVPPWPERELAARLGYDFSDALGVPFSFDDSEGPMT